MQAEQLLQQRNAIHVHHFEVNERQITGFFLRARQRLLASLSLHDLITGRLQAYPHEHEEARIIVHYEDLFSSHGCPQRKSSRSFLSISISISRERPSCVRSVRMVASLERRSACKRRRFSSEARFVVRSARHARPSKAQGVCGYLLIRSSKYCRALLGS